VAKLVYVTITELDVELLCFKITSYICNVSVFKVNTAFEIKHTRAWIYLSKAIFATVYSVIMHLGLCLIYI